MCGKRALKYLVKILKAYMSSRRVLIPNGDLHCLMPVSCGVPKGSMLGPALWNLFYDGLLRMLLPKGARLISFVDDVALVIIRSNIEKLEMTAGSTLVTAQNWMTDHGLELAVGNIEATLLIRRQVPRP